MTFFLVITQSYGHNKAEDLTASRFLVKVHVIASIMTGSVD